LDQIKNNKEKNKKNTDPITYVIWGILLLFFGIYNIYQIITDKKDNLFYEVIYIPIIITVFGLTMIGVGLITEMKNKKLG
jgi:hypothetical protein